MPSPFIIAEIGVNHNGSISLAKRLIDVALKAGADAVKFQTFVPEILSSALTPKTKYQIKNDGADSSHLEMLSNLTLSDHKQRMREPDVQKIPLCFHAPISHVY